MNLPKFDIDKTNSVKLYLKDKSKKIVIITHVNPDGDAIGSASGLYGFLKNYGFSKLNVIVPNEYAPFLHWIPYNKEVVIASQQSDYAFKLISEADTIFCLDFNHPDRLDRLSEALLNSKAKKVLVDHHPQPAEKHFDIVISDTNVSSTAELIFVLINSLNTKGSLINKDISTCLFAGILTDTGSFSYSNNNSQTYIIAAELIEKGVDALEVNRNIYDTYSEDRLRLLGYCLSEKLIVLPNKKVAYISLSSKELEKFNFREGDTEGIVNYALSISGIELAAFFMERGDVIKISFRSRRLIDVNKIARLHFNGGGHLNASGGRLNTTMVEAVKVFENLFENESIIV